MERSSDKLGRIVIPKEIFREWGLDSAERPMMCIDDHITHIRIYPVSARCVFCRVDLPPPYAPDARPHYRGRAVCPDCLRELTLAFLQSGENLRVHPAWVTLGPDCQTQVKQLSD